MFVTIITSAEPTEGPSGQTAPASGLQQFNSGEPAEGPSGQRVSATGLQQQFVSGETDRQPMVQTATLPQQHVSGNDTSRDLGHNDVAVDSPIIGRRLRQRISAAPVAMDNDQGGPSNAATSTGPQPRIRGRRPQTDNIEMAKAPDCLKDLYRVVNFKDFLCLI